MSGRIRPSPSRPGTSGAWSPRRYETGLPVRFYLPPEDLRGLDPSPTRTRCAYKGEAEHLSHGGIDVAWVYRDPIFDAPPIKDRIGFYTERVDLTLDGKRQERPSTPWS